MSASSTARPVRFETWRIVVVYMVVALVFIGLLFRLVNLQVFEGSTWKASAVNNYTKKVSVPAPRGIIYDRNGYILARNVASYNVVVTPADLPDDDADIQSIYRQLSDLLDVPVGGRADDEALLENAKLFGPCVPGPGIIQLVTLQDTLAPYSSVKIKCNVSVEIAQVVDENSVDWPGVSVEVEPIRDFPTGSLTSNLVGFLGPIPALLEKEYKDKGFIPNRDKIGYAGIEDSLQDVLAGRNGSRVVQVDVARQELRNLEPPIPTVPGNNVYLTIDTRLQAVAEASLIKEINYWNARFKKIRISSGVVIAMNPKTGEILAMVSYPSYENNRFARFIPSYYYEQLSQDPRHPLLNNAISAEFPPGSVFKLATATGAINEHIVELSTIIDAPGKLELCEKFNPNDICTGLNTRPFVDHIYEKKPEGFGPIDFLHCIAYSSNVCFYKLGGGYKDEIKQGLGIERLEQYAQALGYDKRSGIELKGEAKGLIPDQQWKRINTGQNWSTGDTYIASVGQGYVNVTPLQVLMSGAAIANNGKLMQPTVVREITDGDGNAVEMWFNPDPEIFSVTNFQTEGSYQISPFTPNLKWDVTVTPIVENYSCDLGYCDLTGEMKIIRPESIAAVRAGTRLAVTDPYFGTLYDVFNNFPIAIAGKTGTAEYCDDVARAADQCDFGKWPTHSWTLAYAPYDDPEIIVVAFAYHGGEGASVAAPIVSRVIKAYFDLKAIDIAQGNPNPK